VAATSRSTSYRQPLNEEGALESNEYTTVASAATAFAPSRSSSCRSTRRASGRQDWIADGSLPTASCSTWRAHGGNYRGAGCVQTGSSDEQQRALTSAQDEDGSLHLRLHDELLADRGVVTISVGFDYTTSRTLVIPFGHLRNAVGQLTQANWVAVPLGRLCVTYKGLPWHLHHVHVGW
jgi:hypothetical protein